MWHHVLQTFRAPRRSSPRFIKKHGKPPENHAWIEYVSLKMMAQAMSETKSTDTDKLIAYFESEAKFDILKARQGLLPLVGPSVDAGGLSRSPSSPRARPKTSGTSLQFGELRFRRPNQSLELHGADEGADSACKM